MKQTPDEHIDIIYRYRAVAIPKKHPWMHINEWVSWTNSAGTRGCFPRKSSCIKSANYLGFSKGEYEIWKFHIGLPTSDIPWFPPENVT